MYFFSTSNLPKECNDSTGNIGAFSRDKLQIGFNYKVAVRAGCIQRIGTKSGLVKRFNFWPFRG